MDYRGKLLWQCTASELHEGYSSNAITPSQVLESCFARYEEVNPTLNAVVTLDLKGARTAAEQSSERWNKNEPFSLLDGVPVTIKDNLFVQNMRTTWGSLLFSSHIASNDDLPVAKLRSAGTIILGKTNTPELSLAGYTDNQLFGPTGNPWAPELTPGGSSGGAAASVMAGIAPLALTTDAAGSTRRPAAYVGCLGLKASLGRISRRFGFPPLASDFQSIGLMARSIEDLKSVFKVVANPVASSPNRNRKLSFGAFCRIGDAPVDKVVVNAWKEACNIYRAEHIVEEIEAPFDPHEMSEIFVNLASVGVARVVEGMRDWRSLATKQIIELVERGSKMPSHQYLRLLDRVAELRSELSDLFQKHDAMLTPTSAGLLWPKAEPFPKCIDGRPAGPRAASIYTTFANLGGLAAINIPAAHVNNCPVGVQLVGPIGSEELLFDLAEIHQKAKPWPSLPTGKMGN